MAGRTTLVSSMLSIIPNFYMQTMWLPSSVQKEIGRISRNFIWGSDGQKKLHLISWETICQPKKQGGLGLKSAKDANLVAMSKLNWRLHTEEGKVWREVLVKKYKIFNPKTSLPSFGSPIIKSLSKGVDLLQKGIKWIPKDGQHISFWADQWIGQVPLNSIFHGPFPPNTATIPLANALHGGTMNTDTVGYHLNSKIISTIKAIPFPLVNHLHGTFSWKGEANGWFSSASAHRILYSNSNVTTKILSFSNMEACC
ncbi:hypothetical protein SLEP1_g21461 [Rubroshorea leprosula]|uniref:Uncharacterized protein n=1 Tax=Rubroshorea leprosula TaxID=152421 RepID=A0AAV5JGP2_9ROSI|nr:hypothetical protein SLEP1_g21461 [Rubroshorea leprosula]